MTSPFAASPPDCFAIMSPRVVLWRMKRTLYSAARGHRCSSGGSDPSSTTIISRSTCSGVLAKTLAAVSAMNPCSNAQGNTAVIVRRGRL